MSAARFDLSRQNLIRRDRGGLGRANAAIGLINESSRCPAKGIVSAAANRGRFSFSARSATAQQE